MKIKLFVLVFFGGLCLCKKINAQDINIKKELAALRINEKISTDAQFNEESWQKVKPTVGFVQYEPKPNIPSIFESEVRVLYDDINIYIAAQLFDPHPDSILKEITTRDARNGNHETFSVIIDTYQDGNNAQVFRVTSAGVQIDSRYLAGVKEDISWNVVWESAVKITQNGWNVELAIPFSALRFANVKEQNWHINFLRSIRRLRQETAWNPLNPTNANLVQQCGILRGISDIKSPIRLSATPYIATYGQKQTATPFSYNFNAGLDIKYGINDAFTVDMTLVPDFGQVQFDNQVLNLSPFEVRFDENRPFFTEGTELFNKTNLFYSRRIGERNFYSLSSLKNKIDNTESIQGYNSKPQLLNATKLSGRTKKGLGLGFFNAIENRETVEVLDRQGNLKETLIANPLTNYNVFVIDQNIKNSSSFTFVNTNVMREGDAYNANVSGAELFLRDKKNVYYFNPGGAVHQQFFKDSLDIGHKMHLDFGKNVGSFQWYFRYNEESTHYNPNDLGYLYAPNERTIGATISYGRYQPFGKFNRFTGYTNVVHERMYSPNVMTNLFLYQNFFWQTRKIFTFGFTLLGNPIYGRDYFLPQTSDFKLYFKTAPNFKLSSFISSDYRKPWAWDIGFTIGSSNYQQHNFSYYFSPRRRINDKLSITFRNQISWLKNDIGRIISDANSIGYEQNIPIFGWRNRTTIENLLILKYSFNAKAGLSFRAREYWSSAHYLSFAQLDEKGNTIATNYAGRKDSNSKVLHDIRYNLFNVDLVYTWRFAPGSDIFITYKNNILGIENNLEHDYLYDIMQLNKLAQTNSLSIKVIYFFDYQNIKKKFEHKNKRVR